MKAKKELRLVTIFIVRCTGLESIFITNFQFPLIYVKR
jgi:hypothetical protein